jgi:hypothetical protein
MIPALFPDFAMGCRTTVLPHERLEIASRAHMILFPSYPSYAISLTVSPVRSNQALKYSDGRPAMISRGQIIVA